MTMTDLKKMHRILPVILLFVLLAGALLATGWAAISTVNFEVRDYAANSVLIAQAKHLTLLYGNYSRVGFNHPGPAILYVLAAGELVLHDWLHLVVSPFSGQLAAVCFYNAAWATLIFAMLRRMTGTTAPALLFVSATLLAAAFTNYLVFNGIWFPLLYFFPFATMLVAISRLVYGHVDMLKPLAVSSGFLINGHASFMVILGVMLVLVLTANWLLTWRQRQNRIATGAFLVAHRRRILVAAAILLLFFLPLIIVTVIDFPGPLYQYFTFGRGSKGHTVAEAMRFVAFYWSTRPAQAAGVALILVLATGVRGAGDGFARTGRALGVAFLAATAALFYYAKKGIDQLDQTYIGLFYHAVPVLAAALVALYAYQVVRHRRKALIAWLLSGTALVGTWMLVTRVPAYDFFYNQPSVVDLYDAVKGLPGRGRVVLDLQEGTADWEQIWGGVLGLQAYALRRGEDLICVNQGWHIANTRAARCRPEELNTDRRFLVRLMGVPDAELGDPDLDGLGLALYRHGAPRAPQPYVLVKDQPQAIAGVLTTGWGRVEGDYVWSEGAVAGLVMPPRASELRLDLGSYVPKLELRQSVQAFVNGKPVGRWDFNPTERRRQVRLALDPNTGAAQRIELRIAHPVSPQEMGEGGDARKLGVSLYGIRIKELP